MERRPHSLLLGVTGILALALAGCGDKSEDTAPASVADKVLTGGTIYTVDKARSTAEAVAISGDRIVFVGSDADAARWIGEATEVVDLQGRLVLPGLHDVHIHPTGIIEFDRCDLENEARSLRRISETVKACIEQYQPAENEWLMVELWNFAEGNQPDPEHPTIRAALDAASLTVGIYLKGSDGHHGGANSVVLAAAKDDGGTIVGFSRRTLATDFAHLRALVGVDATGEPDGYLTEDATSAVLSGGIDDILAGGNVIEEAYQVPKRLNSIGITSIQDAATGAIGFKLYDHLREQGLLSLRVSLAQFYDPEDYLNGDGTLDTATLLIKAMEVRDKYRMTPRISAEAVKIFADGVVEGNPYSDPPTLPNAAMLRPYKQPIFEFDDQAGGLSIKGYVDLDSDVCETERSRAGEDRSEQAIAEFRAANGFHPAQCAVSNGVLESPESAIRAFADSFHEAGFTLHIHAIGDRAVHVAVDAIAQARKAHGRKGLPHGLAHIQFVAPEDVTAIGEQGLYLAYTYAWAVTAPAYDLTVMPFIDQIADAGDLYKSDYYSYRSAYPAASTKNAGAILVAGSDAPVDTRDPRPFINMQQAITRAGKDGRPYNAAERINVRDIVEAYTINGAVAMRQADLTGSIEVGKKADLIVLDRNIIELAETGRATEIGATRVLRTYFDGELVHVAE